MTNGGLLRDPSRLWNDRRFQQDIVIQLAVITIILALSAFYHYALRSPGLTAKNKEGVVDEEIAEVDSLIVYPIKSGRGIEISSGDVSRKGFKFDRRWAVVRKEGLKRLNLKDEPLLTHIIPSMQDDVLRLHVSEVSAVQLPDIGVPLEPSKHTLSNWPLVENISFYGDSADGREAQLSGSEWNWNDSPSAWVSELVGYPVHFLQFEPASSKRIAFPTFKPPHDVAQWDSAKQKELAAPTQIEFQDLYPFLVATRESLSTVNQHLRAAMANETFKVDKEFWQKQDEVSLPIQRFRPNIVLRSRRQGTDESPASPRYPGFSEDSWETIWIQSKDGTLPIHLVARCERCLLTTVDPKTAHRDPNVPLAILRKNRSREAQPGVKPRPGPCFGMYSIPEQVDGRYTTICVGDPVRVRWRPYELDDEYTLGARQKKVAYCEKK